MMQGNPVAVATGNDGQVLTSTGAGSPPAFETPASATNANHILEHMQVAKQHKLVHKVNSN